MASVFVLFSKTETLPQVRSDTAARQPVRCCGKRSGLMLEPTAPTNSRSPVRPGAREPLLKRLLRVLLHSTSSIYFYRSRPRYGMWTYDLPRYRLLHYAFYILCSVFCVLDSGVWILAAKALAWHSRRAKTNSVGTRVAALPEEMGVNDGS